MLLARLEPWHWWLGVILAVATIVTVLAFVGGYVNKVVRPQHPSRHQRQQS
jgi:hypothetical protein